MDQIHVQGYLRVRVLSRDGNGLDYLVNILGILNLLIRSSKLFGFIRILELNKCFEFWGRFERICAKELGEFWVVELAEQKWDWIILHPLDTVYVRDLSKRNLAENFLTELENFLRGLRNQGWLTEDDNLSGRENIFIAVFWVVPFRSVALKSPIVIVVKCQVAKDFREIFVVENIVWSRVPVFVGVPLEAPLGALFFKGFSNGFNLRVFISEDADVHVVLPGEDPVVSAVTQK